MSYRKERDRQKSHITVKDFIRTQLIHSCFFHNIRIDIVIENLNWVCLYANKQ